MGHVPAVGELPAHLLEVVVAHVIHIEDNAVLVLGNLIANVLEELILLLTGLLGDLGEVDNLCALGLGHLGRIGKKKKKVVNVRI